MSTPRTSARWAAASSRIRPISIDRGRFLLAGVAAQHRLDPQNHLARAERLRDVVVGAELETDDAVELLALGGEHDERQAGGRGIALEQPRELEAVEAGEHQIEHDEVGQAGAGSPRARCRRGVRRSTAKPARSRLNCSTSAMSGSSSTTRMRVATMPARLTCAPPQPARKSLRKTARRRGSGPRLVSALPAF